MEHSTQKPGLGGIYALLSQASSRPRYAFLVLQLIAELADERGHAGPFVKTEGRAVLLREWLCDQLLPMSERPGRRASLRRRVEEELAGSLLGNPELDAQRIEQAVDEQVRAVGRANVSRAVSGLVKAGIVSRFYQGFATNHVHQGGGRNVVYVVKPEVLQLLPKARSETIGMAMSVAAPSVAPILVRGPHRKRGGAGQGDLFAA
jgi:predicted transcriptional regulator